MQKDYRNHAVLYRLIVTSDLTVEDKDVRRVITTIL
jgi:hypothetical protein